MVLIFASALRVNCIQIVHSPPPYLGVVLLGLELELQVKGQHLGLVEVLGLLLEPRVRESLLESHTVLEVAAQVACERAKFVTGFFTS
jgi:hypothetical protein